MIEIPDVHLYSDWMAANLSVGSIDDVYVSAETGGLYTLRAGNTHYIWDGCYDIIGNMKFSSKQAAIAYRDAHFAEWFERMKTERILVLL